MPVQRKKETMTYIDSAEGVEITRGRVILEFDRHGIVDVAREMQDFLACYGHDENQEIFSASEVLQWLGY